MLQYVFLSSNTLTRKPYTITNTITYFRANIILELNRWEIYCSSSMDHHRLQKHFDQDNSGRNQACGEFRTTLWGMVSFLSWLDELSHLMTSDGSGDRIKPGSARLPGVEAVLAGSPVVACDQWSLTLFGFAGVSLSRFVLLRDSASLFALGIFTYMLHPKPQSACVSAVNTADVFFFFFIYFSTRISVRTSPSPCQSLLIVGSVCFRLCCQWSLGDKLQMLPGKIHKQYKQEAPNRIPPDKQTR